MLSENEICCKKSFMEKEYRQQLILEKHGKRNTLTVLARNKKFNLYWRHYRSTPKVTISVKQALQLQISAPKRDSPH